MINLTKPAALTFAVFAAALSFGAGSASAATCDGTWSRAHGHRLEKQCYYLPTVSNGRVTGLELKTNYRNAQTPGAAWGPPVVIPHRNPK
jgi:uncharacterized membrane protein